jgi:hypothetical protein
MRALIEGQIPSDAALVRAFKPVSAESRANRSIATAAKPSKAYVSVRPTEQPFSRLEDSSLGNPARFSQTNQPASV